MCTNKKCMNTLLGAVYIIHESNISIYSSIHRNKKMMTIDDIAEKKDVFAK